jgi:hypothetical protein
VLGKKHQINKKEKQKNSQREGNIIRTTGSKEEKTHINSHGHVVLSARINELASNNNGGRVRASEGGKKTSLYLVVALVSPFMMRGMGDAALIRHDIYVRLSTKRMEEYSSQEKHYSDPVAFFLMN